MMLDLNAYLGDLVPRERVYDVSLNRRLAMRVFPNGTRVWVYWRAPAKDARGRTIGVFPQMNAEQALADTSTVLEWSRFSNLPEAELPDDTDFIQTGNFFQLRRREQRIREWATRATAGAAVTLVSILILKWVLSPLFAQDPETVQAKTPLAPPPAQETPGELLAVSKQPVATASEPRIRRATFASDVVEHEPVDALGERIASWPDAPRPVYMFTDLQNLAGHSVYHRWYWQDELQSEVEFEVGSDWRWRVFSRRYIEPGQIGTWVVSIVTGAGDELARYALEVDTQ
ncbi:MAG: DUF2914 domain-containing protein [Chromatiales bacterium]|jgi:hypothetical protein